MDTATSFVWKLVPGALAVGIALFSFASPGSGTGPYEVPSISRVVLTVPAAAFVPEVQSECLARAEVTGSDVDSTFMCYTVVGLTAPPPPPPPPYALAQHQYLAGNFNKATGALLVPYFNCTAFIPGVFAASLGLGVELDSGGGPASGSAVITTDSTAPFDCVGAPQTTGPLTLTPLAQSHNEDSAESQAVLGLPDPCEDYQELGSSASLGGLRDPFNPYDFFDVDGDHSITIGDISGVASRYLLTEGEPGYEPRYDRGDELGPNPWNVEGPDEVISVHDISAVATQFLHAC